MFSEVVLGIKSLRTTDDTRPTISSDAISCNIFLLFIPLYLMERKSVI